MPLFPNIAKDILGKLIKEECEGSPVTFKEAIGLWAESTTWVELINDGSINCTPGTVTATKKGRKWYNKFRYQIEAPMNLPPA